MLSVDDAALIQTTLIIPKKLYAEFKEKVKTDGFNVNDAICSLIYNYNNDVYKK